MLDKLIAWTTRYIPYPETEQNEGIDFWRARFLYLLIVSMLVLGTIAYIPSMYVSVKTEVWSIAIVDTVALVLLFFMAFSKFSVRTKTHFVLVLIYLLGVSLLVLLGPQGAGFIWLFLFPVIASILLNFKAVLLCTLLLAITFSILAIPVILRLPGNYDLIAYNPMTWLVNVVNFLVVNFVISAAISIIISRLSESISKERKISKLVKEEQKLLIREKKKAEEADLLKSIFLANMSHEIRTPMNGILGFMELLRSENLEKKTKERYLGIIQQSGKRMLSILNDLINISKIEANQMEVSLKEIAIEEVIQDMVELFRPLANKKSIKLEFHPKLPEGAGILVTDKDKIIQVLTNLIQNAIKFTEKGGIRVECFRDNEQYTLAVRDTGRGIAPGLKAKIFERFHHTVAEADKVHNGAGLGLAISRGYVELLGGRIWVESTLNKGTSFYFTIPCQVPVENPC